MKIIYHHRTQMDDAQGIHITEIIKAFKKLGHTVHLFSLVKRDEQTDEKVKGSAWELISKLVPNLMYELMEILYNLFAYFKLVSKIKTIKPDFIYERYSMYNFCGVLAAKRYGIPIVVEVNAPLYFEQLNYEKLTFKSLARRIENWICNNSTKTIVVTSSLKEILVAQGVNEDNLVVMSNGINPDDFNNNKSGKNIRTNLKIPDNAVVIGIVGWFREWHGLDFLIKVCNENQLFKRDNIVLMFIGDGPAVPESKELTARLNLNEYIKFTGSIERKEIPNYVAALDIALQPRVTDYASPMKIIEYLAMGKAIVAPDQQNIRDILINEYNALLFKPEDKEDLFNKIKQLIDNDRFRQDLALNAKKTIEQKKLYWKENAKNTIELIQN